MALTEPDHNLASPEPLEESPTQSTQGTERPAISWTRASIDF